MKLFWPYMFLKKRRWSIGIVCFILYFVLRKKSVFTKYTEGYKHVLLSILKYGLIVYGSISLVFSIILAILNFC